MDEKTAWERFLENGSVTDYLEYKNCLYSGTGQMKTEFDKFGENNRTGAGNTGANRRGVR